MTARRSPILETVADLYAASKAGQTGSAERPFSEHFEKLLRKACCTRGEALQNALADLESAHGTAVVLVKNKRSRDIQRVTVPLTCEAALFAQIGRTSPAAERAAWVELLHAASAWPVPVQYAEPWRSFCEARAALMARGEGFHPFRRAEPPAGERLLKVIAALLAWTRPTLLRKVSQEITGDTKFLVRARDLVQSLLAEATGGQVASFADLGISDHPRHVLFHGPVRIRLDGQTTDYAKHLSAVTLGDEDLARAGRLECAAPRCVTVENETTFHELRRLGTGDLFVHTSYPNSATLDFLRRLPPTLPRWHFGDTDPFGFDVLRDLRAKLAPLEIAPLHMEFRATSRPTPLNKEDWKRLEKLLAEPLLADVHVQLDAMRAAGTKEEQESLVISGAFPYLRSGT